MFSLLPSAIIGASLIVGSFAAPLAGTSSQPSAAQSTAVPFDILLNDNPSDAQLRIVEGLAHGTLPNGTPPPPGSISDDGITSLQLIEFNENFERAFFASLIQNITNNVPGFELKGFDDPNLILQSLIATLAQEDLHALNAKNALKSQNKQPILPCKYKFPSNSFDSAIAFAATFTDVVLGTLQDVIEIFADNNDNALTRGVASVVGQEGEQEGFYRILQNMGKIPNALPFLTTSTRDFAFSALEQNVIVPGSCPNDNILKQKLKIFGVLNLLTQNVQPKDQTLQFSFDIKTLNLGNSTGSYSGAAYNAKYDWSQTSLVYINQQNTPIVEKLQNVKVLGSVVTFDALFPFQENLLNSLTIAAVTKSSGPFAKAVDVAKDTLFAPALIEVN